jgi:hypothetical protein
VLPLGSNCGPFRWHGRWLGKLRLHDLRAVRARSAFLEISFLRSRPIFGLMASPAGIAVERVDELVPVRCSYHLPNCDEVAEKIALTAPDASDSVGPGQDPGSSSALIAKATVERAHLAMAAIFS